MLHAPAIQRVPNRPSVSLK